ncbi:hypothetical protein FOL47_002515 [Perkinsus chesapeaki]|uniref:Uncharacterized protein n=1 Tax=Perkinsus chesapeaki TaxID=330153 RepID=A0A7J6N0N5_PERCH|nr:hypothetical protein FOL47_002515 [Perkinsus chesapeaki]
MPITAPHLTSLQMRILKNLSHNNLPEDLEYTIYTYITPSTRPTSPDDLFSEYTDEEFVNFMVEHDEEYDEIFLDAIVHDNHVTHILFAKADRHLCVWRPGVGVYQTRVPNICICRFVPGTNGKVVAGVFGHDRKPRGFNIFNIYDGKVPGRSLSVEKRLRVVSLVIMPDWRVSLVTYNDWAPQGARGVAKVFQLSKGTGSFYDHGFNSHLHHYDDCYNEGYDSDGERELLGLNDRYSSDGYEDYYDNDW